MAQEQPSSLEAAMGWWSSACNFVVDASLLQINVPGLGASIKTDKWGGQAVCNCALLRRCCTFTFR